jgi:hypothetical protein
MPRHKSSNPVTIEHIIVAKHRHAAASQNMQVLNPAIEVCASNREHSADADDQTVGSLRERSSFGVKKHRDCSGRSVSKNGRGTLGLRKENLDRILRAIQVKVIVAGIGKTYESLGLIGERVQPLTKRDRHHPIALTVQE